MKVSSFAVAAVVMTLAIYPAQADCLADVRQVYADVMNPFERPAYRSVRIHRLADGTKIVGYDDIVETPIKTISVIHGSDATLTIDRETWTGPGPEGPWSSAPNMLPEDRRASLDRNFADQLANLVDAACHGETELDGQKVLHFSYSTKSNPDPDQGGLWFGAREDIYIHAESGLLVRQDMSEFVSSFQSEPNGETSTATFEYDDGIAVRPPR